MIDQRLTKNAPNKLAARLLEAHGIDGDIISICHCPDGGPVIAEDTAKRWKIVCCYCATKTNSFKRINSALNAWNSQRRCGQFAEKH